MSRPAAGIIRAAVQAKVRLATGCAVTSPHPEVLGDAKPRRIEEHRMPQLARKSPSL